MPDGTYQRLDLVTVNGDSFVSNIDGNRERPSRTAGDWTLSAARGNGGGGGVTSLTDLVSVPSNGQLLIGNGSGFVNSTLTAGTGISISNGAGSITINATDGNITLDDGTAAAPALNFTNEPTTGLFRASANVMGFAVNGVSRATMTTTGVTVTGTITPTGSVHAAAGSVGNPSLAFDADQDTGLFRIGANNLGVAIGGAKVLDVASTGLTVSTGNLVIGTAGNGIDFSATAGTGTSELLNDYEEGSWTPVVAGATTAGTVAYSSRDGYYTKIGRLLYVWFDVDVSSFSGGSGSLTITGFPFSSANSTNFYPTFQPWFVASAYASTYTTPTGSINPNTSVLILYSTDDGHANFAAMNVNQTGRIAGYVVMQTN